jgi:DNA-binding CsgD family transcriptional regulator
MNARAWGIVGILLVQVVCATFFISDILSSYIGLSSDPVPWEFRELIEIGAAGGLGIGVAFGAWALWTANRERHVAEERLRLASGAFVELLRQRFAEWRLTPAEADVAFFAIKGLSTAEIAAMRKTSEGTVKAHRPAAAAFAFHRRPDAGRQCRANNACRPAGAGRRHPVALAHAAAGRLNRLISRPSMKNRPEKITRMPSTWVSSNRSCSTSTPSRIAEIGVMKVFSDRFVAPTRGSSQ